MAPPSMSHALIDRSPDLLKLHDSGYRLGIADDAFLIVKCVPYVTPNLTVHSAELIMVLTLKGDITTKPGDHVAYWSGAHPHRANGVPLDALLVPETPRTNLSPSFPSVLMFSAKASYRDYWHKVTTYVEILEREARSIEPTASARTHKENAG